MFIEAFADLFKVLTAAIEGDGEAVKQALNEMFLDAIEGLRGVLVDGFEWLWDLVKMTIGAMLERMAQPDTGTPRNVLSIIDELGAEMAVEEVALAERFAAELEARVQRQAVGAGAEPGGDARPAKAAERPGAGLPGMSAVPRTAPGAPAPAVVPGSTVPGMPGKTPP